MLGHSPNNFRMIFDQIVVSFLRRIFYPRQEKAGIIAKPMKYELQKLVIQFRIGVEKIFEIGFIDRNQSCWLNAFDSKQAGLPGFETFDWCYGLAFEKKLQGDIFPVFIKKHSQTTLFYKENMSCYFSFLKKNSFWRHRPFNKKGIDLIQILIFAFQNIHQNINHFRSNLDKQANKTVPRF